MRSLVAILLVAAFLLVGLNVSAEPETAPVQEERRRYVAGGSMMGTQYSCWSSLPFDIGAACDIPCPGNTCNITVVDEVRGSYILFRICFPGETFCRPNRFLGSADVPGSIVTVVPDMTTATTGTVTVR